MCATVVVIHAIAAHRSQKILGRVRFSLSGEADLMQFTVDFGEHANAEFAVPSGRATRRARTWAWARIRQERLMFGAPFGLVEIAGQAKTARLEQQR